MIIYTSNAENLAKHIRALRKKNKVTQKELAESTWTDVTTISRYERWVQNPGIRVLLRILRKLGEKVPDWLFLSVTTQNDTFKKGIPRTSDF